MVWASKENKLNELCQDNYDVAIFMYAPCTYSPGVVYAHHWNVSFQMEYRWFYKC